MLQIYFYLYTVSDAVLAAMHNMLPQIEDIVRTAVRVEMATLLRGKVQLLYLFIFYRMYRAVEPTAVPEGVFSVVERH